jgi:MFS transporter, putative metabolite:H+ symporter
MGTGGTAARPAIMFRDRRVFWFGTGAVVAGVVLQLPVFLGTRDVQYRLVGMPVDPGMLAGMGLIVGGLALSAYGLVPARFARRRDDAALIGLPATFVVAWLYGFWSSRWTMIAPAALTATTLATFAAPGDEVGRHRVVLQALIVLLLVGTSSIVATLTPYRSEVYPTRIRARGTGLAGMCARAGGLLGVGVVVVGIAPASLRGAALLGAVPVALAALAPGRFGIETRRRGLEEITVVELRKALEAR